MNKIKFSEEAWLAAGFRALTTDGPTAIRAEALARNIGASKGSFYWNFADLPSFKLAMLGLWQDGVVQEIENLLLAEPDKLERLNLLAAHAANAAPDEFGGRRVEPAMRSWALTDSSVLAVVNQVDKIRLSLIAKLLGDIGKSDPALAHLVYGAFIGLDDLASKDSADIGKSLDVLLGMIMDL
jgi:AcrR family transcriptional regulator